MTTTAKIICTAKGAAGDGQTRLGFSPDYANGSNAEWAKYTPSLSLSMTVRNEIAGQFKEGMHFTLTFEEAPVPAPDAQPPGNLGDDAGVDVDGNPAPAPAN